MTGDERTTSGQQQKSERERFFTAAAEQLVSRRSSPVTPPSVCFAREDDGTWSLSNGLVRLSGRVGGKYMVDEIAYGDAKPIGRWGALLEGESDGIPYWTDVSRVTDVSFTRDDATGIVTAEIRAEGTGRAGSAGGTAPESLAFAFTHRLSLAPENADVLAEIVSLENTRASPFKVKFLFMRPFAIQADPGETDTVPNLWKGPVEDYWTLEDGSLWGVASHDPGVLKTSLWYRDEDKSQHPDVRCMEGKPFLLAPGETFRPSLPMGALIRCFASAK